MKWFKFSEVYFGLEAKIDGTIFHFRPNDGLVNEEGGKVRSPKVDLFNDSSYFGFEVIRPSTWSHVSKVRSVRENSWDTVAI